MHNRRMTSLARRRRSLLAVPVAAALLLAGCSDDGSEEPTGESTAAEAEYLPAPEGVELTTLGSELELGEKATVAWEPDQETVGVLDITVTGMERASFKQFVGWNITEKIRQYSPYFLHAEVTNVGETDLGGERVPLYGVDGENLLLESWKFPSSFKPCPSEALPKKFRPDDSTTTCLVVMAPDRGDLVATSFRPVEEYSPIVWTGEVTSADARGEKDGGKKDGGKKDGGKKDGGKKDGGKKDQDKGSQRDEKERDEKKR
jgi:hypothetical protein